MFRSPELEKMKWLIRMNRKSVESKQNIRIEVKREERTLKSKKTNILRRNLTKKINSESCIDDDITSSIKMLKM